MGKSFEKEIIYADNWYKHIETFLYNPVRIYNDMKEFDELILKLEEELDKLSLGVGYTSTSEAIDKYREQKGILIGYINDIPNDIKEYLDEPLYSKLNLVCDKIATISMKKFHTDNRIGLKVIQKSYPNNVEKDASKLTLEDFIGSRYNEDERYDNEGEVHIEVVKEFVDMFESDYYDLVVNGIINEEETTLETYLDGLIIEEFQYSKDSPALLELIEMLTDITIVIPLIEMCAGRTLITGDYLTEKEVALKGVSVVVNLITLGFGLGATDDVLKLFASELIAELTVDAIILFGEEVEFPPIVTIILAIMGGSAAGTITTKQLTSAMDNVTNIELKQISQMADYDELAKLISASTDSKNFKALIDSIDDVELKKAFELLDEDTFKKVAQSVDPDQVKRIRKIDVDLDSRYRRVLEGGVNTATEVSKIDEIITDGSHLESGKLKPNVTYKTGEHDYIYRTNEDGLITNARTDDLKFKTHTGRLDHNSNTLDKEVGDHAGHLFGDRFGGSPELDNLVSQARKVNLSEFKVIENQWAKAIKNGQKVTVDININYAAGSCRPVSFDVSYTIDGVLFFSTIAQ